MKKLGFIGTGNMAMAILSGIFKSPIQCSISAYDINGNNYDFLLKHGVAACATASNVVARCDYIVLAVKPQNFPEVLEEIRSVISKDVVLISIAAGITEEYIAKTLGFSPKVVRVMPNTPLLIGKGATALAAGERVSKDEFEFVRSVFSLNGETAVIPSDKMNEIIAINGSSPAFIYLFTKGFVDYAVKEGISDDTALKLFCASLKGAADMMLKSDFGIDQLIKMVSSPGGTTLAGLKEFEENNFLEIIDKACESCTKRAYELSK